MAKDDKKTKESAGESVNGSISVLLVDNDKDHARAMTESLERIGLSCTTATSGPDGAKYLADNLYDIVVTDLMMNEIDGMAILRQSKETQPECEVVMVTGHASVPLAVEAMKEGAFNFLEKPITPKRLQAIVAKAADSVKLRKQNQQLHRRLDERFGFENLIYASESMKSAIRFARGSCSKTQSFPLCPVLSSIGYRVSAMSPRKRFARRVSTDRRGSC